MFLGALCRYAPGMKESELPEDPKSDAEVAGPGIVPDEKVETVVGEAVEDVAAVGEGMKNEAEVTAKAVLGAMRDAIDKKRADAANAATERLDDVREKLRGGTYKAAYAASYAASFGASLLKDLVPSGVKEGVVAGEGAGKDAFSSFREKVSEPAEPVVTEEVEDVPVPDDDR